MTHPTQETGACLTTNNAAHCAGPCPLVNQTTLCHTAAGSGLDRRLQWVEGDVDDKGPVGRVGGGQGLQSGVTQFL